MKLTGLSEVGTDVDLAGLGSLWAHIVDTLGVGQDGICLQLPDRASQVFAKEAIIRQCQLLHFPDDLQKEFL